MKRTYPWSAVLMFGLVLSAAAHAAPVSRDAYPGSVLVHYVKLTGHGGDNDEQRRALLLEYEGCVGRNKVLGRAVQPLQADQIPAVRLPVEHEIYYSANRTLSVKRGVLYIIDQANCALRTREHHMQILRSSIGKCDIDVIRNEARGRCDSAAHARASASDSASAADASAVDMGKVPSYLRAQVETQIKQTRQQLQRSGTKTVAGHQCTVYRLESGHSEKCVANPPSPFAIPAAPFNEGLPGILLAVTQPAMTLEAQQVTLNLRVSENLFTVPAGAKIYSAAGEGKR